MLISNCNGNVSNLKWQEQSQRIKLEDLYYQILKLIIKSHWLKCDIGIRIKRMWGNNRLTKMDLQLTELRADTTSSSQGENGLFNKWCNVTWRYIWWGWEKREKSWLLIFPHTIHNINFRRMTNLHGNFKIIKLLKENRDYMTLKINKYFN